MLHKLTMSKRVTKGNKNARPRVRLVPCRVIPPAWIGPKAVVEAGARIGPNATVNGKLPGTSELVDAALLEGELAEGEKLHGAVRLGVHTAR